MVLPDVRSPVAVVIYTDTHTYKQKVLLYSKFMFNTKATANGDRYVRENLMTPDGFLTRHSDCGRQIRPIGRLKDTR